MEKTAQVENLSEEIASCEAPERSKPKLLGRSGIIALNLISNRYS